MQEPAETRTSAHVGVTSVTSSSVDEGRFVPGTLIVGRYRIISLLGRGGMGEVYRATDLTLGQPVALKFLPNTGDGFERMLERFQNEVRVARQVSHPNVCRVYDLGEFEGMPYMSMEYVDGEDLAGLLARIGRLPADKALDIARKICAGLAAAHDKGVIHRDLKPANIMLDRRGNAIIMDFGLAAVTNELRGAEARSGSPAYQAPEQLRGEEVTAKSDIYALGLVLYELFTGKRAYEAKSIAELIRVQEEAAFVTANSIAAEVDPSVDAAIRKCLNPEAAGRPASALSVSALLPGGDPLAAALAAGETPSPELVAAAGRIEGLKLRHSAPIALGLIAFFIAVPFLRHDRERHSFTPLALSPEVLASRAREMAESFGYPAPPSDYDIKIGNYDAIIDEVAKSAKGTTDIRRWFAGESPMRAEYRESPGPLLSSEGVVSFEEPAPTTSGMISAVLTSAGELRYFSAVPQQNDGVAAPTPVDAALIARATGMDITHMEETQPRFTPLQAFDWQRSWKGKHPKLAMDIQVDVAAWHGKLTHLHVIFPWTRAGRTAEIQRDSISQLGQQIALRTLTLLAFLFSLVMAARNWTAGRGDRVGAIRISGIVFLFRAISHLCALHWVAQVAMFGIVVRSLSIQLAQAGSIWLMYLALEPAVRARWPRVLVSWTRVLRGQWRDPMVGMRVLQGALTGSLIVALVLLTTWWQGAMGALSNNTDPARGITVRHTIGDWAALARNGIEVGLLIIFIIFLFKLLLRRDWAAALAMALVMTVSSSDNWNHFDLFNVIFYLAAMMAIAFVMLHIGLLATAVGISMVDLLLHTPGPQDLTKWYEWTVIAYPLMALTVVLWAFWQTSGQELMRTESDAAT